MATLLDIAKANRVEAAFSEAAITHPEMDIIPAFDMKGLIVKSVVYTAASNTTGSFRNIGEGTADISETSEERDFQCLTAEPRVEEERAVADRFDFGAEAWLQGKASRILDAELLAWCKQMYYGVNNNAKGFPGLVSIYDRTNMEVDAAGTTATTGSSVWLLRVAPPGSGQLLGSGSPTVDPRDISALADMGVRWRFGMGGRMAFDPVQLLPFLDPANSALKLMKYHTAFTAYPGFQVPSLLSVCRIKKLTADAGKGLTDTLINQALAKFRVGKGPNLILMSQRSAQQLQASRTATNPTGAPAPWANEILGMDGKMIPIRVTEAINNIESLTL